MVRIPLWMRVGMTVAVDPKIFKESPELAFIEALGQGKVFLDGETYMPQTCVADLTPEDRETLGFQESDEPEYSFGTTALIGAPTDGSPSK